MEIRDPDTGLLRNLNSRIRVFICSDRKCSGRVTTRQLGERILMCPQCVCHGIKTEMVEVFKNAYQSGNK